MLFLPCRGTLSSPIVVKPSGRDLPAAHLNLVPCSLASALGEGEGEGGRWAQDDVRVWSSCFSTLPPMALPFGFIK